MTTPKPINRKVIDFEGRKGKPGYVRMFVETVGTRELVRVQWRELGARTLSTESFENTRSGKAEAKAFMKGTHERLTEPRAAAPVVADATEPMTLKELKEEYFAAHVNAWKTKTLQGKASRWKLIGLLIPERTLASAVTPKMLDTAVTSLVTTPIARKHKKRSINQVRMTIAELTAAFRWAVDERGILPPTRVVTYAPKLGALKKQVVDTAEYSADERARLIAALDPRDPMQWRAWALNTVFGFCGPRQTATRHLEVTDIELDPVVWKDGQPVFGGRIHWPSETDKMENERTQPMPAPVAEAFWIALGWREFDEYTGRFIFYGAQRRTRGQALRRDTHRAKAKESLEGVAIDEKPYTYSALNAAMKKAEDRAGIEHINYRSTHGHRRGVSGDIHQATGSSKKAADYIGDRSTKVVEKHYLLTRVENLDEAASIVTAAVANAGTTTGTSRNQTAIKRNRTKKGAPQDALSNSQPSNEGLNS